MNDTEILDKIESLRFAPMPRFEWKFVQMDGYTHYEEVFEGWIIYPDDKVYPSLREAVKSLYERSAI